MSQSISCTNLLLARSSVLVYYGAIFEASHVRDDTAITVVSNCFQSSTLSAVDEHWKHKMSQFLVFALHDAVFVCAMQFHVVSMLLAYFALRVYTRMTNNKFSPAVLSQVAPVTLVAFLYTAYGFWPIGTARQEGKCGGPKAGRRTPLKADKSALNRADRALSTWQADATTKGRNH